VLSLSLLLSLALSTVLCVSVLVFLSQLQRDRERERARKRMERKGLGDRKILIFHDVGRFSCINVVEPSKTREFVSMFVKEKAQKEKQNSIYTSIHGKKERKEGRPRLPENPVNRGRGRNRNDVGGDRKSVGSAREWLRECNANRQPLVFPCEFALRSNNKTTLHPCPCNTQERKKTQEPQDKKKQRETQRSQKTHIALDTK